MKDILPTPATVHWGYFDATLQPIVTIEPGDTIRLGSVSGGRSELPPSSRATIRPELAAIHNAVAPELGPHILTEPVAICGAEPGDALRIEIVSVELADDWGFNVIKPGLGDCPRISTMSVASI